MTETTNKTTTSQTASDDARIDVLLRHARPMPDAARESALLERIMAAAEKGPRLVAVAPAAHVATTPTMPVTPTAAPAVLGGRRRRDIWAAGSLLAASLVVGVFLGQSTFTETTVQRIEQTTGIMLASVGRDLALSLASAEDEDE